MGKGLLFFILFFINILFVFFGYYVFVIRPGFLSGGGTTTLWLLRLYESFAPYGPFVVIGTMAVLWIITTPAAIFGMGFADLTGRTLKILPFTLIVSGIASLPAFVQSHDYIEQVDFEDRSYNLVKRNEPFDAFRYSVFECDRISANCRQIFLTTQLSQNLDIGTAPEPVEPESIVEVNGQRFIVRDTDPTTNVAPMAELMYDTTEKALGIRIANTYQTIVEPAAETGLRIVPLEEE